MTITDARRIVSFIDEWHMPFSRLAAQLGCGEGEAALTYRAAKSTCNVEDARKTVAKLNELAAAFNVTTSDLIAQFA